MEDNQELHMMYQDRQRSVEEAIERAETGKATESDWNTIRFECGLKPKAVPSVHPVFQSFVKNWGGLK